MKEPLWKRLMDYARKHPDGFTVKVKNGKIRKLEPTSKKRFVVSKTNNDTKKKIKLSFRNDDYSGYAGGWVDQKTGKVYIDKNLVLGDKEKAIHKAKVHDQLAIFDLLKFDEIRVQKKHGEYRKKKQLMKKQLIEKAGKLPVVKKGNRWFNTLTKKYVSESYAKRINNYFIRNPSGTLVEATGHGKYDRDVPLSEHSKTVRKLAYGKGNQIIKTKDKTGKTVYYSPMQDEVLTKKELQKLKKLDYKICNGVQVELYRLTRDRQNLYHILRWEPYVKLVNSWSVDMWEPKSWKTFQCILKEANRIAKKHGLGNMQTIYIHVSSYFYSDIDGWESGKFLGNVLPNKSGDRILLKEWKEFLEWNKQKLDSNAYHNILVQKVTFYIWNWKHMASEQAKHIAQYRIGVNRV